MAHHHGQWLALLMFSSPALKCAASGPVETTTSSSAGNTLRLLILPGAHGILDSRVLSRTGRGTGVRTLRPEALSNSRPFGCGWVRNILVSGDRRVVTKPG